MAAIWVLIDCDSVNTMFLYDTFQKLKVVKFFTMDFVETCQQIDIESFRNNILRQYASGYTFPYKAYRIGMFYKVFYGRGYIYGL